MTTTSLMASADAQTPVACPKTRKAATRRVDISYLSAHDDIVDLSRIVPAVPIFDEAFAAFARGTLFVTGTGPVAVEDLLPGDRIKTTENGFQTLLWRGSTMIVPQAQAQDPRMGRLTRIAADALGLGRPMPDLVLGPHARLVHRARHMHGAGETGPNAAFVRASDFIDGVSVVELRPVAAVQVFHLGFAAQQRISANGVEVESHHPGAGAQTALHDDMRPLYLSLFPHMASLAAFGAPALPRIENPDRDLFAA